MMDAADLAARLASALGEERGIFPLAGRDMPYRDALRAARAGSASLATKVEKVWSVLQSATDLPEVPQQHHIYLPLLHWAAGAGVK